MPIPPVSRPSFAILRLRPSQSAFTFKKNNIMIFANHDRSRTGRQASTSGNQRNLRGGQWMNAVVTKRLSAATHVMAMAPSLALCRPCWRRSMCFRRREDGRRRNQEALRRQEARGGKIKLDVPEIAENGLVVPINIEVESPMTEADYVKAVHVFADGNPLPGIVSYSFTPACGKASAVDPHAAGPDAEHRLHRRDVERQPAHGQGQCEGHDRRLRRLRPPSARQRNQARMTP